MIDLLRRNLQSVNARLHVVHQTPNLGNRTDPTEEFVYIVLSRKTDEQAYQRAFEALRGAGGWDDILHRGQRHVERLIYGCGLEKKKALAIVAGLMTAKDRFGEVSLNAARALDDEELFCFLASLPEVGPKTAKCVMLYSFGRAEFPVDAHVGRIAARYGAFDPFVPGLRAMTHKQRQSALSDLVPPSLRYPIHVNFVAHGRTFCQARAPRCTSCVLRRGCASANTGRANG